MSAIAELTRSDLEAALDFVARLGEADDLAALRCEVIEGLGGLVDADSITYTELDTETGAGRWWTDPPEIGERADAEAFAAHIDQHPIAAHHAAHGGSEAVQFSDFLSRRELRALPLYNDFYGPLGVEHQLAIAVDAPHGVSVPISVQSDDRAFDLRARGMLELLHPHLTHAYRRVEAEEVARAVVGGLEGLDAAAVVLLDPRGRVELSTGPALRWLERYLGRPAIPGELPAALAERLAEWRAHPDYDTADTAGAHGLVAEDEDAALLVALTRVGGRDVLLLEERRRAPDIERLRELGLTPREAEVLMVAAERGGTTGEIAEELTLSPHTVRKHLEHIHAKLGVSSRAEAVAAAMRAGPA